MADRNNNNINNNELRILEEARLFRARLISLGYDEEQALNLVRFQNCLMECTTGLARLDQVPREGHDAPTPIAAHGYQGIGPQRALVHDDVLLPYWQHFANALSSCQANIRLTLSNVQLEKAVTELLLRSIGTPLLRKLFLDKNDLGREGLQFVANAVKKCRSLEVLFINDNPIASPDDTTFLVKNVIAHPRLDRFYVDKCAIGRDTNVIKAILPAFESLRVVSLEGDFIESHGARLISECLSQDSCRVETLSLEDNLLNDDCIEIIAQSLKMNTNLKNLYLAKNPFTQVGIRVLNIVLLNIHSLNALHSDSNHTCLVWGIEQLSKINYFHDPEVNRKVKLLAVLSLVSNFRLFDNAPIGLMPRVIEFLQGRDLMSPSYPGLDNVFQFTREWSMPLSYINSVGIELRRSDRIRKKTVMKLMGR